MLFITVENNMGNFITHCLQKFSTQSVNMFFVVLHLLLCNLASLTQTNHKLKINQHHNVTYRRRQRTGSKSLFLPTSRNLCMKSHLRLSSHIKGTDAFRSVNFVTTYRHEVDWVFVHINRNLPDRLSGVSVEKYLFRPAQFADFFNRLHHTDFIVHVNHWNN